VAKADGPRGTPPRRRRTEARQLLVVAGPNGAGKSTFVDTFLKPAGILIVNPDEVAKGLAPHAPDTIAYEAARVADTWRRDLVARGVSFCMETVFSDPQGEKLAFLKDCQARGYTVILVFIGVESAELSRGRVMQRVEQGGHDVPDTKIEARFPRTLDNLRHALTFVDEALLFDNSSSDHPFRFVAAFKAGLTQRRTNVAPAWAKDLIAESSGH
jgi:predicted ABC-type ATPase